MLVIHLVVMDLLTEYLLLMTIKVGHKIKLFKLESLAGIFGMSISYPVRLYWPPRSITQKVINREKLQKAILCCHHYPLIIMYTCVFGMEKRIFVRS